MSKKARNRVDGAAKKTLSGSIEKIVEPSAPVLPEGVFPGSDSEDTDVLSYVNAFMREYSSIPHLPKTSLMTREGALQALDVLNGHQALIQKHIRTVAALKKLLRDKGDRNPEQ